MAFITETAEWAEGIYQYEQDDVVEGGPDGIDNIQAKALAARTNYLKALLENLQNGKQTQDQTLTAIAALATAADKFIYFTGEDQAALGTVTAFARSLLAGADAAAVRTLLSAVSQAELNAAIAGLVNSSPATLDTLKELADALGDDPNFATTMTNALAARVQTADLQKGTHITATAGGNADALTGSYTPGITALTNGMTLYVRAGSANATTTPTFTPNSGTIAAKQIVKGAGAALAAGDIAGGGHWIELQYDQTLDKWVLLNPATGVSPAQSKQLQSISASVAANALTLTYAGGTLDFRNATLTSGAPNAGVVVASNSITIPSGATLGTVNGQQARLLLLEAYNGGSPVACVVNLAGGVNLDETTLISPTTISAAATSASTIYSASAVAASSPFRVVGYVDVTEATAGTWASAPTVVQGTGGQALAAMSSIGYGQTLQNVTGSRALGTTYYNTTGKPIVIHVEVGSISTNASSLLVNINGGGAVAFAMGNPGGSVTSTFCNGVTVIPPGASYAVTATGTGANLQLWSELR